MGRKSTLGNGPACSKTFLAKVQPLRYLPAQPSYCFKWWTKILRSSNIQECIVAQDYSGDMTEINKKSVRATFDKAALDTIIYSRPCHTSRGGRF